MARSVPSIPPASKASSTHGGRGSTGTATLILQAAERLFAARSIDSVSLNEITAAAGQKNRSALQYHFGNRSGLLQALIDRHAARVHVLRERFLQRPAVAGFTPARAAARGLILPLAQYIDENPAGVHYVKILSQLAALNHPTLKPTLGPAHDPAHNPAQHAGLTFQQEYLLATHFRAALAHLDSAEAQQRLFLTVSLSFHGLADICRASEQEAAATARKQRNATVAQLTLAVESLLTAPPVLDG